VLLLRAWTCPGPFFFARSPMRQAHAQWNSRWNAQITFGRAAALVESVGAPSEERLRRLFLIRLPARLRHYGVWDVTCVKRRGSASNIVPLSLPAGCAGHAATTPPHRTIADARIHPRRWSPPAPTWNLLAMDAAACPHPAPHLDAVRRRDRHRRLMDGSRTSASSSTPAPWVSCSTGEAPFADIGAIQARADSHPDVSGWRWAYPLHAGRAVRDTMRGKPAAECPS